MKQTSGPELRLLDGRPAGGRCAAMKRARLDRYRNRSACIANRRAYAPPAALGDAAAVEHEDVVGVADGREPVADDERRPAPRQLGEPGVDILLGLDVQGSGRLVEDQHLGVADEGTGQRRPLPLTLRQVTVADAAPRCRPSRGTGPSRASGGRPSPGTSVPARARPGR